MKICSKIDKMQEREMYSCGVNWWSWEINKDVKKISEIIPSGLVVQTSSVHVNSYNRKI